MKLTEQDVMNRVAEHLLLQNQSAQSACGRCLYLAPNGLKCAIGCLIPGGHAAEQSNASVEGLLKEFPDLPFTHIKYELLMDLQTVHDMEKPDEWPGRLIDVAERYELEVPACC